MKVWTLSSDEGVTLLFKNTKDLLGTLRFALADAVPETRRWSIGQRQISDEEYERLPTPGGPRR